MALTGDVLTTLDTLKGDLGISGSAEDTTLEGIIYAGSAVVQSYCNRPEGFHREDGRVDSFAGTGDKYIYLPKTPLLTINSITYDSDTVDSTSYEIHNADAGLLAATGHWIWTSDFMLNASVNRRTGTLRKLYSANYDGGYVTPQQVVLGTFATATLPADLEMATRMICSNMYRNLGRDMSVKSEKLMDASQTWGSTTVGSSASADLLASQLPMAAMILKKYRRHTKATIG